MIDISESGIRFETSTPQEVSIKDRADGEMVEYDAQLVWPESIKKARHLLHFRKKNLRTIYLL